MAAAPSGRRGSRAHQLRGEARDRTGAAAAGAGRTPDLAELAEGGLEIVGDLRHHVLVQKARGPDGVGAAVEHVVAQERDSRRA